MRNKEEVHTKESGRRDVKLIAFASEETDHFVISSGLEAVSAPSGPSRDGDAHVRPVREGMGCIRCIIEEREIVHHAFLRKAILLFCHLKLNNKCPI